MEAAFRFLFVEHFEAFLPALVTIAGFWITYQMTKKNIAYEIEKSKKTLNVEAIKDLPYEICQIMNEMIESSKVSNQKNKEMVRRYAEIMSKVLSYGSADAVAIAVYMQQQNYQTPSDAPIERRWKMIAAYSLLISQLKYDLTSEIMSPEKWFQLKIKEYDKISEDIRTSNNELVKELGLKEEFFIETPSEPV